jgi:hypothetical protein
MRQACSAERQRTGHTQNCNSFSHLFLHHSGRFKEPTTCEDQGL